MLSGANVIPCNDLQTLFDLCNERYFNGTLKPAGEFTVRYGQTGRQLARFRPCPRTHRALAIELSPRLQGHPQALRSALVREMIPMLALQQYLATGNDTFLDREPLHGHLFVEPGLGAFFLAQMEHLNLAFPELCLTVKPRFGSGSLFDPRHIPAAILLLVPVSTADNTGIIYRLHDKAPLCWQQLRETAWQHHGARRIQVLKVAGALAEDYPTLRKDNRPRANARLRLEEDFDLVVQELRDHRLTAELQAPGQPSESGSLSAQFARWHPEAHSNY